MCDLVCFLLIVSFCYHHAMTHSRFKCCLLSILSSLVCLSPRSVIYSISSTPRSAGRIPDHLSPRIESCCLATMPT